MCFGVGLCFGVGDGLGVGERCGVGEGFGVGVGFGVFSGETAFACTGPFAAVSSSALTRGIDLSVMKATEFKTAKRRIFRNKREAKKSLDFME